jgi:nucleoside-diphosphate-sugar epimerase
MGKNTVYKNILVTGATGFLGGRLVERLSELGHYTIYATGRNAKKGLRLGQLDHVTFIPADLEDKDLVLKLCEYIDVVIHAAALSSMWGSYEQFHKANVLSTEHIVTACHAQGVKRLVHISTPSIYPQRLGEHLFNVDESFVPKTFISFYGQTKYEAEQVVNQAFKDGLETVILRPRAIYGRGDYTIMPRLLRAYNTGRLKVIGDGENINDLANVSNVVDAILLSIHGEDKALGHAFNITDGESVKMWSVVAKVLEALNLHWSAKKVPYAVVDKVAWAMEKWATFRKSAEEPILTRASVHVISHSTTLNIEKAQKLLGYNPKYTLDDGLKEFIDWWKSEGNEN